MLNRTLRYLFFLVLVRPVIMLLIGLNTRNRDRLPDDGPAIVVANHNSHLDALVLMTLFGMSRLDRVRPVAAADHFLRNPLMSWFSRNIIGIIPLQRDLKGVRQDPLAGITEAIEQGRIVLLFPEGSRGEPEVRNDFKTGIAHVAKRHDDVPITPVFLHGLGKALPKGEGLLVPFFCDVFIGDALRWTGKRSTFMEDLESTMQELADQVYQPEKQTVPLCADCGASIGTSRIATKMDDA